jgi:glycosyltransferase involved in cell wall biosynthesis
MGLSVSVVIPTYGRAEWARQATLSALGQTSPPDEVIVSDDCSPDNTFQTLQELTHSHPQLRVIRRTQNLGPVRNSSQAMEQSRGDLIANCCDDDLFLPWHLANVKRVFDEDPEVGVVHAGFHSIESQPDGSVRLIQHPMPRRPRTIRGAEAIFYLMRNYSWPFHASTWVFRRSTWDAVGPFNPEYELADTDWFLRSAERVKIAFLPEPHALNRRHPRNLSNAMGSVAMHEEVNEIALSFIDRLPSGPTRRAVRRAWLSFNAVRALRLAIARARAGYTEGTTGALKLFASSVPFGSTVPESIVEVASERMTATLSSLQAFLPGGSQKYAGLGVSQPK